MKGHCFIGYLHYYKLEELYYFTEDNPFEEATIKIKFSIYIVHPHFKEKVIKNLNFLKSAMTEFLPIVNPTQPYHDVIY